MLNIQAGAGGLNSPARFVDATGAVGVMENKNPAPPEAGKRGDAFVLADLTTTNLRKTHFFHNTTRALQTLKADFLVLP